MSPFEQCFMFLDNPRGGTDQLDKLKAAGYQGCFVNVGDYAPALWDHHRAQARAQGMFCGPWARTQSVSGGPFDPARLALIVQTADAWGSPLIVNSEKEIDNTGAVCTTQIANAVGTRDAAISMEVWPFGSTDWKPVGHLPMLPQVFPPDWGWATKSKAEIMDRAQASKGQWHLRGIKCVYFTFAGYGGMTPSQYELQAPFSMYTADSIGLQGWPAWKPTSTGFKGCIEVPTPPPPAGAGNTEQTRTAMTNRAILWEEAQPVPGPKPLTRITIAKEIVRLDGISQESWKKHAPTFRALIDQAEQDE